MSAWDIGGRSGTCQLEILDGSPLSCACDKGAMYSSAVTDSCGCTRDLTEILLKVMHAEPQHKPAVSNDNSHEHVYM